MNSLLISSSIFVLCCIIYQLFYFKFEQRISNTGLAIMGTSLIFIKDSFREEFRILFFILLSAFIILGVLPILLFGTKLIENLRK